jgi:hypothetical protein
MFTLYLPSTVINLNFKGETLKVSVQFHPKIAGALNISFYV